ncbi:MAG: hypothetical protein GY928_25445 [Colwellia sp.]|nr:hypothetical protein [Colwellia sp.]
MEAICLYFCDKNNNTGNNGMGGGDDWGNFNDANTQTQHNHSRRNGPHRITTHGIPSRAMLHNKRTLDLPTQQ